MFKHLKNYLLLACLVFLILCGGCVIFPNDPPPRDSAWDEMEVGERWENRDWEAEAEGMEE